MFLVAARFADPIISLPRSIRQRQEKAAVYPSGTNAATLRPPSMPEILKLPTGPGASNVPWICKVPPADPEPLTVKLPTNDRSVPHTSVPFTVTSLAKAQFLRVVV